MATETIVNATQKWVKNRIEEVRAELAAESDRLTEHIDDLAVKETEDVEGLTEELSNLQDSITTGALKVEGDAEVDNSLTVHGPIKCGGLSSTGPLVCSDPAGLLLQTPGRAPTGLNATTLSLVNERGKMARFFLRGDQLVYDYEYEKIYFYFDKDPVFENNAYTSSVTGSRLRFLHRQSTPLESVVADIESGLGDGERERRLGFWFDQPGKPGEHKPARLNGNTVYELFPAIGTSFMIPESILFDVPETYRIKSIQILDGNGRQTKVLHDFSGRPDIRKLLVNFPYVRKEGEETPEAGVPIYPRADENPASTGTFTTSPLEVRHVADFENGYYEVTDPNAVFNPTLDSGLIPNVLVKIDDFSKDLPSILYFHVEHV